MTVPARFALTLSIAITCVACASKPAPTPTSTPSVAATATVPPVSFAAATITWSRDGKIASMRVEVASTPTQSERGLGYRDSLPEDAGMLFDLHSPRVPVFWMKGMRFPLDMVWIGEDKRVAGVTAGVQPQPGASDGQLRRVSPAVAVRYVLEINAGAAARQRIEMGTQLMFNLP